MAYIFKVKIDGISKPPVWRRIVVPKDFSFARFHKVIQVAFGWEDVHLYKFSDRPYGGSFEIEQKDEGFDQSLAQMSLFIDAEKTKLSDFFSESRRKIFYLYDFGDDWVHSVVLEDITDVEPPYASCLQGKGACPPEDVGGPMGYENMKRVLREDPESEEAASFAEWLWIDTEEDYNPNEFSLKVANIGLEGV